MACARCDFYIPKPSGKAQMLEAKADVDRRLALIPLTDGERAAIEQDRLALNRLHEGLVDTPTPAGPTPRELAVRPTSVHAQRDMGSNNPSNNHSRPGRFDEFLIQAPCSTPRGEHASMCRDAPRSLIATHLAMACSNKCYD